MFATASPLLIGGFVVLPALLGAGLVLAGEWAGRRLGESPATRRRWAIGTGLGVLLWLGLSVVAAASGVLRRLDMTPPPFAWLVLAIIAVGILVPCSSLGTRLIRGLPLAALVGYQVFRFPLELLMHRAYVEGVMPVQMSYSGWNFDILTGISAGVLGVALLRWNVPRFIVHVWNVAGFALLVNIVTIAVVSTPAFGWFGRDRLNVWVTYPPFVWLPAVMVTAALMGHLLVWRTLGSARAPRRHAMRPLRCSSPRLLISIWLVVSLACAACVAIAVPTAPGVHRRGDEDRRDVVPSGTGAARDRLQRALRRAHGALASLAA